MNIIETIYQSYEDNIKKESAAHKSVSDKCLKIYNDIFSGLNEEYRKKLISLSDEYCYLDCISHENGFCDGFSFAVKMLFEAVLSS